MLTTDKERMWAQKTYDYKSMIFTIFACVLHSMNLHGWVGGNIHILLFSFNIHYVSSLSQTLVNKIQPWPLGSW